MIKRACLITLVLFFLYSAFVAAIAPSWWHVAQNQWQGNIVRAQKFIYNKEDTFTAAIVGSSLASRLITDSLPGTYNLSFDGLSIYDGLEILSRKKNLPKNVFIETNVVLRKTDNEFISDLFSPIPYYVKKNIIALRDDRQPVGIIGDQLYWRITNRVIEKLKDAVPIQKVNKTVDNKNNLFLKMLEIQVANYSRMPDAKLLDDCFTKLSRYIAFLQSKGVTIVFFEMPVNNELVNLPQAVAIRSRFNSQFPAQKYRYVLPPDSVDYKTSDGLHLNENEARAYTSYFKAKTTNFPAKK